MQVEPASVWLKEEFGACAFFPENDGSFNIQPIMALSGSLNVEGMPRDDTLQSQNHTPQHMAHTMAVPVFFRSVVTHQRPGGQSVSVKVIQAQLSFNMSGKTTFEKLDQVFIEIGERTVNVAYILSVARAEFGANHTLVTNDGLELQDSTGTQG